MFAKNRNVQRILIDYWKQIIIERKYVALVEGIMENDKGVVTSWLSDNKKYIIFSSPVNNGGKYAVTNYITLKRNKECSLVELRLQTGRTNQIRVHMKELGHPIVGDEKYGNKSYEAKRLCLHAKSLCFYHPVTNAQMKFISDIPNVFLKLVK